MPTSAACWAKSKGSIEARDGRFEAQAVGTGDSVPHKRQDIGLFLDDFRYRLA
jgi:hypothetical protein